MKFAKLSTLISHIPDQAIPYRTDGASFSGALTTALAVTVALLAILFFALLIARKKGWLARWTRTPVRTQDSGADLHVTARLRLSPNTHAYVLRRGLREYLVLESSQSVRVLEQHATDQMHED